MSSSSTRNTGDVARSLSIRGKEANLTFCDSRHWCSILHDFRSDLEKRTRVMGQTKLVRSHLVRAILFESYL